MSLKYKDNWYHFEEDLENYPDCWCYIVFSKRGPGKTYSCLKYAKEHNIDIMYMKRTNKDVDLICGQTNLPDDKSPNPYAPLNIDMGWNIKGELLEEGFGQFGEVIENEEGKQEMINNVALVYSLNKMKDLKGFNLRGIKWLVFDEFVPQPGEVVKHAEGEMLLSVYMTVNRSREKRGEPPLKLILFANADSVSTYITNELEVTDDIVQLAASGKTHRHIEERGILIHHITNDECPVQDEELTGIARAMQGTAWYDKNFGGEFAGVDMTQIKRMSLKNMQCWLKVIHKRKPIYIYIHNESGMFYACRSQGAYLEEFDLSKDADQKRFYNEYHFILKEAFTEGRMNFSHYSMYDVLINFKKFFKV